MLEPYKATHCSECGAELSKRRPKRTKTTLCAVCTRRNNGRRKGPNLGLSAKMKAKFKDPEFRQKTLDRLRNGLRAYLSDPENMAAFKAKNALNIVRGRGARLKWCPVEYREAYLHLRGEKRIKAKDAKKLILDQIEADHKRYLESGVLPQAARKSA